MSESEKHGCQSEVVCNLVKSSLSQARKSHQTYVEMSEKMIAAEGSEHEFKRKVLDFAKQDASANFDFALNLLDAQNLDEVIKLQDAHANQQTNEMARRVAELQAFAGGEVGHATTTAQVEPAADNMANAVAEAAAAALLSAGVVTAAAAVQGDVLQTGELDSNTIAAELEQSVDFSGGAATAQPFGANGIDANTAVPSLAESDLAAEIEALAARIHEAKSVINVSRNISDEDIAAAVAEMEEDEVVEIISAPPAPAQPMVEMEPAEFTPAVIEAAPESGDLAISASDIERSAAAMPAAAAHEAMNEPAPHAKNFSMDLAEQLDAVRAMIRGGSAPSGAEESLVETIRR